MALGTFGGRGAKIRSYGTSGGSGSDPVSDMLGESERLTLPSTEGMPAASAQVMVAMRGISHNLVFSSSDADTVAWATGTITLSDGTSYSITGSNTGNMAALTYIYLDIDTSTTALQVTTTYSTAVGNNKYLIAVAQNATTAASYIVVSGNGGIGGEIIVNANMISNLLITAAQIANATITSGKTVIALRNISHNLVFSSTDEDTVAWASGTITLSDGTAYSISGGNTGTMAARTYIYLDPSTSTTVLQTTTTAATASADGKYLIATAINVADTDKLATFTVFSGAGGVGGLLITSADQIAALTITAAVIDNLTITAAKIAAATITSDKTVVALRNISHDLLFSSTDHDTVAWASGTITLSDGTAYSISGGNTGTMAARTYIYLNPSASTTVLQTTTTAATAVGDGKYLIASAINVSSGFLAPFQVFDGYGGVGGLLITASGQIANAVILAENIGNAEITATQIENLTITASQIANLTLNTSKMTFAGDAAFGANYIVNGSFESWSAGTSVAPDGWTLTGAGAAVARIATAGNVQYGQAAVTVTAALNTATDLAQSITVSTTLNTALRGPFVTFSCKVKCSTASRVFLKVDDGIGTTSSSNHSGGGGWETLTVTRDVDDAATKVECSLEISSGASISATFDGAMLTTSQTAVEFSKHRDDAFVQPRSVYASASTTTTSGSDAVLDTMTIANVILDGYQSVILAASINTQHSTADSRIQISFYRDSTQLTPSAYLTSKGTGVENSLNLVSIDSKPAAGSYTYTIKWNTSASTATATDRGFTLVVIPTA